MIASAENLQVVFPGIAGATAAVRGVSFSIGREKVGLVGESGSGKSTIGRALLRMVPRPGRVSAQKLEVLGADFLTAPEAEIRRMRGRRVAMILQDPRQSLDPVIPVGRQIVETWRTHFGGDDAEAGERALDMLAACGFSDGPRVFNAYPHELSGGEGQRAMIAMMLIASPELLIADEPTSALDVTVRLQVLRILDKLVGERGMGLLFISHDLRLVASFCDRILVLYAGRILESLPARDIAHAAHPYTRALWAASPKLGAVQGRLPVIARDPAWLNP